jgi:hypothetical protein
LRKGFSIMKNFQSKALIAVAVAAVALIAVMAVRHSGESGATQKTTAELVAPQVSNSAIVDALRGANVDVTKLSVRTTGGIVVLRGSADRLTAERAVATVKSLGFARVANLITERAPIASSQTPAVSTAARSASAASAASCASKEPRRTSCRSISPAACFARSKARTR